MTGVQFPAGAVKGAHPASSPVGFFPGGKVAGV